MTATIATLPGRLLTSTEAAAYLSICTRSLWGLTRDGKIKLVRPTPNSVRYRLAELDRYVAAIEEEAAHAS